MTAETPAPHADHEKHRLLEWESVDQCVKDDNFCIYVTRKREPTARWCQSSGNKSKNTALTQSCPSCCSSKFVVLYVFCYRNVCWFCTMTITTLTSKEHLLGEINENTFWSGKFYLHTFLRQDIDIYWCLCSWCFSLGVALSRGHGKFFFRGNVTVEEGMGH